MCIPRLNLGTRKRGNKVVEEEIMSVNLLLKSANRHWLIGIIVAATVITGAIALYGVSQFGVADKSALNQIETTPRAQKVIALARLEPEAEVIKLSAPLALDGDRLAKILVAVGDSVKVGQIVAILDSSDRLQDAFQQTQQQINVASAKLAQVKAGAKIGEIQAQKATVERVEAQLKGDKIAQVETIARLKVQLQGDKIAQQATIRKLLAELNNAEAEYQRYQQLYKQGVISNSLFDSKRLIVETNKQQLNEAKAVFNRINATGNKQISEAKATLNRINATGDKQISEAKATFNSIAEVRAVDVQAAQSEVDNANSVAKHAKTDLEAAYIKAPITGKILKINTRIGEKIGDVGIADLAQTDKMVAVTEVYQTDISKVKLGQQAIITSQAFPFKLRGTVSQIGLQVNRQNVFSNQPGENLDRRVIEVKIRLQREDSQRVAGFTNLQVQTAIEL